MNNAFITLLGKTLAFGSKLSNRGSGSTWPGHIALGFNKKYIQDILQNAHTEIILIVGTNGKTTTGKILTTILEKNNRHVFQNNAGANLVNGVASALLTHTNLSGKLTADFAIFEVDENNLPLVLQEFTPKAIIVLDLFRDQLDRYGELDSIAKKWQQAFAYLPESTHLILNADDPLVAYLGQSQSIKATVSYFGLDQTTEKGHELQHAADTLYCPRCNNKLHFTKIFYAHVGVWKCLHCKLQRPIPHLANTYFPLDGTYNKYNTLAAALTAEVLGLDKITIEQSLHTVTPAFGRQEKLTVKGKTIQIFLAKNPTSFNETLRTIQEKENNDYSSRERSESRSKDDSSSRLRSNNKLYIAFVLNDRIPDGRDVSWIWDIDFEAYAETFDSVFISGDRTFDMALRLQYASKMQNEKVKMQNYAKYEILNTKYFVDSNLKSALQTAIEQTPSDQTLYILPTYSAMLDVRKILTGRKIL
jgi:UDP-N-acetylmuramyl tripeptide synthase